jgi:hypothetical protein
MSAVIPDDVREAQRRAEDWRTDYRRMMPRRDSGGLTPAFLVTGLVVVGLGLMAWQYLGPDLRRYLKISNM